MSPERQAALILAEAVRLDDEGAMIWAEPDQTLMKQLRHEGDAPEVAFLITGALAAALPIFPDRADPEEQELRRARIAFRAGAIMMTAHGP